MTDARILPMREEDYDDVRALWMTIRGFGIRALDDSREDVTRFIRRNPTTSVVARVEGRIVGSILCGSDGRQGALYHVCVAREYRRQGIGTRMVGYCMERLREMGINKVALIAFANNEAGNDARVLLVSRFDNLGKGASGAAIQNMNLLMGADETEGLVLESHG